MLRVRLPRAAVERRLEEGGGSSPVLLTRRQLLRAATVLLATFSTSLLRVERAGAARAPLIRA